MANQAVRDTILVVDDEPETRRSIVRFLATRFVEYPYRKPRSDQHAREEIAANVGSQFDAEVHEAFFRIPPEEWAALGASGR